MVWGIYNSGMNDNTYYKPCTKCGRPQTFCKGECCGKPQGCNCREYGPKACGCIRQIAPKCPFEAVIPSVTVDTVENIKDLADCFVHVVDINTTFYIDDKHRIITTWSGPVEYDNYDLTVNPLGLRSQFLIDFANDRGAYYDKTGAYKVFNFGGGVTPEPATHLQVSIDEYSWVLYAEDSAIGNAQYSVSTFSLAPAYGFTGLFYDPDKDEEVTVEQAFNRLESGEKIIFDHVPVGQHNPTVSASSEPYVDGVELTTITEQNFSEAIHYKHYNGVVHAMNLVQGGEGVNRPMMPLGVSLMRERQSGEEDQYYFLVQEFAENNI